MKLAAEHGRSLSLFAGRDAGAASGRACGMGGETW